MRRPRIAPGLRVLSKLERRQVWIANARAGFPNVLHQRFELTIQALESRLRTTVEQLAHGSEVAR